MRGKTYLWLMLLLSLLLAGCGGDAPASPVSARVTATPRATVPAATRTPAQTAPPATPTARDSQQGNPAPNNELGIDLLIFAPHPDDETLCCAGLIVQALEQGQQVRVVIFTNGDGYPAAARTLFGKRNDELTPDDYLNLAGVRQAESRSALQKLGLDPAHIVLLGYPDAGLDQVYAATGPTPFRQGFTQKSETYGMLQQDYHTQQHGQPAPYLRDSALGDVKQLIQQLKPAQIYVTGEVDTHPDHKAAFWLVRDAIDQLGFAGDFYTYLIHGGETHIWPSPPGFTPDQPFRLPDELSGLLPWPPTRSLQLSDDQIQRKLEALGSYQSQMNLEGEKTYLESFVKAEEIFWLAP